MLFNHRLDKLLSGKTKWKSSVNRVGSRTIHLKHSRSSLRADRTHQNEAKKFNLFPWGGGIRHKMTTEKQRKITLGEYDVMISTATVKVGDLQVGDDILVWNRFYHKIVRIVKINKKSVTGQSYFYNLNGLYRISDDLCRLDFETFKKVMELNALVCDRCDKPGRFLYQDTTGKEDMICRVCVDSSEIMIISENKEEEVISESSSQESIHSGTGHKLFRTSLWNWYVNQDKHMKQYFQDNKETLCEMMLQMIEDSYQQCLESSE